MSPSLTRPSSRPPAVSRAAVRHAFAARGLAEYSEVVEAHLPLLLPAAGSLDNRALLDTLKRAGIAKMGVRQKAAALLAELSAPAAEAAECASDFWSAITEGAAAATSVECPSAGRAAAPAAEPTLAEADGVSAARTEEAERFLREQQLWEREKARQRAMAQQAAEEECGRAEDARMMAESAAALDATTRANALVLPGISSEVVSFEDRPVEERAAILRMCGNQSYAKGDLKGAESFYHKVLLLLPRQPEALNNLAACALASTPARPSEAVRHLEQLLEIEPRNAKARLRLGKSLVLLGRLDEAAAEFEAALTAASPPLPPRAAAPPPPPPPNPTCAAAAAELASVRSLQQRIRRARSLAAAGRPAEALAVGREAAAICSHCPLGAALVGAALEGSGELRAAEAEVEAARARWPDDAELALCLARVVGRQGRVEEAEAALQALAAGEAAARAAAALAGLRAAVGAKARGNAAYAAAAYDEAVAAYGEALAADGEGMLTPLLLGNRAQAYLQAGRHEEALQDAEFALKLHAASEKLRLRRAAAKAALGWAEEARREYEAIAAAHPEEWRAAEALRRLDARAEARRAAAAGPEEDTRGREAEEFDPYAILGVPHDANFAQVKAAYRKAVLAWHPDKYAGEEKAHAATRFHQIKMANNILSDAHKRGQLDAGISTAEDLAYDEKQDQWNKDYEYYSQSCPNGYKRESDVGQRRWNPTGKVSATFELNPCRIDPHVLQRDNAAAKAAQKVIPLKGPSAKTLEQQGARPLLSEGSPQ
ncbi:hypothetical protein AB1Y20_002104 [Prymnesium parvum]|uniref:J domain-containing protein n=1 Tax=Prymnesium parvum TaxID=97485 RepID=A0AB34J9M8_PRYPA